MGIVTVRMCLFEQPFFYNLDVATTAKAVRSFVVSEKDKCSLQKLYEKFAMISQLEKPFSVMIARKENSDIPTLFLCVENTPLAIIPHRKEILKYDADFELSEVINEIFEGAFSSETRATLEEFNGQGPKGMRKMFWECADAITSEYP